MHDIYIVMVTVTKLDNSFPLLPFDTLGFSAPLDKIEIKTPGASFYMFVATL